MWQHYAFTVLGALVGLCVGVAYAARSSMHI